MAETTAVRTIRPNSIPQETFLSSRADIAIYGGSAGGGKTWAELIECVRHIGNPNFGAVVFRRLSPQITSEGGLWDESGDIYPLIGGVPRVGDYQWVFPSGARVTFHHLQHEQTKYAWQGSQIPLICFDELTHFSESQFWYLASRNRSTCGVRPYIRGTCNADGSSWVKRLCAPWVDRKFPDPAASGEVRWLVRKDGLYHWGRTREDMVERFPSSNPDAPTIPKSVTFVRASLFDNVDLLRKDPDYLGNLQAQSPVEQARLLHGDWDVVNDGLVYPEFGSCVVEPEDWPSGLDGEQSGGIDWGFNNPFAALNGVFDGDDVLWIWGERYGSKVTLGEHSKAMPRIPGRWWGDPAGADQIAEVRAAGHDVVPCVHLGQNSLENGIGMVTERIRTGRLKVLGTCGNTIEEAGKYRYDPKTGKPIDKDNHALAALRYLIVGHDRGRSIDPGGKQALERERDRVALQGGKQAKERERIALELQRTQEREREEAAERERRLAEWLDPDNDFFFGG